MMNSWSVNGFMVTVFGVMLSMPLVTAILFDGVAFPTANASTVAVNVFA